MSLTSDVIWYLLPMVDHTDFKFANRARMAPAGYTPRCVDQPDRNSSDYGRRDPEAPNVTLDRAAD
jgi:hypothetical protein